jgi:Skp family chaperone for outer membrane proteins
MNSKLVLASALAAAAFTSAGMAQTAGPQVPAAAAPTAPPPPVAVPAKIAFIELQEVAAASNEGQQSVANIQKKYEPQRAALEALKADIDSLTKQLQTAPASMSDDEKASRARTIDTKQKQLQRDGDDAQTAYSADVEDALGKVLPKLGPVLIKYVQDNGYTMLLDNTGQAQQGGINLLWGGTDISRAVLDAYNTSSGVAAPMPSAPSAPATRPRSMTPPKPSASAPKQ